MNPTSEILERITKSSTEHKDGVFTRLYRYLLREDIYYAAYQKLYANKGSTTKGVDDDTADHFSEAYVNALIQELRDGTYRAKPVRREYIAKKNGKMRPLGIPSFRDKLLQEAVRMILEAIYEPVFDSNSHGFRPHRSCHTALSQIKKDFTGIVWFIEGDITGCFDNIDHEVLIDVLAKKIKDSKFLNLIRQFLKAGYVENWQYNKTYSGTPQGGICSPILANIYLNELDMKFREMKARFDRPRTKNELQTPEYHAIDSDGSGQQFITLVSKSGNTFYLVIDRNSKGAQTVHFMNLVDEADLLALMEEDAADAYTAEKEAAAQAEQDRLKAEEEAKKAAEEAAASGTEQPKENKVTKIASGFLGVVVLIALAAGGIFYAFAKQKQKKQAEKEALDPDANYTEDKGDFEIPVEDEPEEAGEEDNAEE